MTPQAKKHRLSQAVLRRDLHSNLVHSPKEGNTCVLRDGREYKRVNGALRFIGTRDTNNRLERVKLQVENMGRFVSKERSTNTATATVNAHPVVGGRVRIGSSRQRRRALARALRRQARAVKTAKRFDALRLQGIEPTFPSRRAFVGQA